MAKGSIEDFKGYSLQRFLATLCAKRTAYCQQGTDETWRSGRDQHHGLTDDRSISRGGQANDDRGASATARKPPRRVRGTDYGSPSPASDAARIAKLRSCGTCTAEDWENADDKEDARHCSDELERESLVFPEMLRHARASEAAQADPALACSPPPRREHAADISPAGDKGIVIGAADWTVVAVTTLVVGLAVFLHFEVIAALNRWTRTRPIDRQRDHHHRPTLLIVISVLLATHIAEIWLFGGAYWLLINIPDTGAIIGYDALTLLDCIYFSATTYTTVGWGDLYASGAARFLAGTEALVGFMLITWSASFTYLVMDRTWGKKQDD